MISAAEAPTNAVVGLLVSWAITYYALPLWGLEPSVGQSLNITLVYFCVAFAVSLAGG